MDPRHADAAEDDDQGKAPDLPYAIGLPSGGESNKESDAPPLRELSAQPTEGAHRTVTKVSLSITHWPRTFFQTAR